MGSEEGDGMASVDAAASWQQYYTWCGPYSHPHSHSHPHSPATGQPHTHSHPHYHHPNHLNQYQTPGQYQQQSLAASTANASAHYSTSQQYHMQLQPAQTPPLHQQHQFHPVKGQIAPRRAAPYDRTGKQGKDGPEEKKDADGELWGNVEAQAAFLGPNLWDKTLPYDADLKVLNHYVDLDEFLSENGIPVDGVAGGGQGTMQSGQLHKINNTETPGHQGPAGLHLEPVTKRERSPSPSECCSPDTMNPPSPADSNSEDSSRIQYGLSLVALSMASSGRDFDPRTRAFSDEELKPQPMIKKSRKQFVPDDLKDDKYWARRRKNNMAAKRSRDARRMKENQIALRAGFLEKENMGLRQELDRLKNENMLLRDKLSKYTDV
ncbi:thyrotroph embryonic factor isoform X3 [Bombus vosnesenskii]|uniref:Thyrotroph embryonic factor isoform X3 n=3 Tax=Pyrobombus TaxID=144703 RepID=A0A6J3LQG5_9HYME|nr:thyrotroph embryonic factor isoform X3 [Bombus impatiens]XP_033187017.1 thyrotroph embryonic factor isoform X3 [Bombus vancouverensis nearcticus]XP_033296863.1 thyrotroph embryonic factor isoform X3 [Bombus bifarius]XP_033366244.1 thyrotroph embryonic factor isoform X3 [Bombus vosnesenskii]XP_050488915.1 thyrotroph embryonic factor isoform X3 [Bombus huntii]